MGFVFFTDTVDEMKEVIIERCLKSSWCVQRILAVVLGTVNFYSRRCHLNY